MLSWLAIISHLARHNLKRTRNPLMRADEPSQKPQYVDDDGYDASDIDQEEQSAECSHNLWLHDLFTCRSPPPNVPPQSQPPGSQAPTKPGSNESPQAPENRRAGGCWLQGEGWASYSWINHITHDPLVLEARGLTREETTHLFNHSREEMVIIGHIAEPRSAWPFPWKNRHAGQSPLSGT